MTEAVGFDKITKTFANGKTACNAISFSINKGEIFCIAGENGAGKTTLMRILYGIEQPSTGQIRINGKAVSIRSPQKAGKLKIGMVQQHFMLFPEFTVAQNVTMGREPVIGRLFYNNSKAEAETRALIESSHLTIKPEAKISSLTIGEKQQIEILKMLYRSADIMIFDEPTSVLGIEEKEAFYKMLGGFKAQGKTIILITHKIGEIKEVSDRIAILKEGKLIDVTATAEVSEKEISKRMFGTAELFDLPLKKPLNEGAKAVLSLENVTVLSKTTGEPILDDLSFTVHSGEILGFAALSGNGLAPLEQVLSGTVFADRGRIIKGTMDITNLDEKQLRDLGFAYVPSDRLYVGSALYATVSENLIAVSRKAFTRFGFLNKNAIHNFTEDMISRYEIHAKSTQRMGTLSGGNIQKTVLAREMNEDAEFLIFCEPTQGVDAAAIHFIHQSIIDLREKGKAILLLSSNLDEILALSDRIIVLYQGRITNVYTNDGRVSKAHIGRRMLGLTLGSSAEKAVING